jgi:hypothetical protein
MTDPATGLPQPAADEALLVQLAEALRPVPRTPPPASVSALRRTVAQKWRPTVWSRVMGRLLAWARRLQRTGAAVAVFGGLAVGGSGMALAAGGSTHETIPYRLHNPGIPVVSPAAQHPAGHVTVGPRAALRTTPTTLPRRRAKPLTSETTVAPTPPGRSASGGGASTRRPWSAPETYRDGPLAGSAPLAPPTGRLQTSGTCGAYRCAAWPAPGSNDPAPSGRTTPTAWSGAPTTGSWPAGPGPVQTGAGGFAPTSSWDRQSPADTYATASRYRGSGLGW